MKEKIVIFAGLSMLVWSLSSAIAEEQKAPEAAGLKAAFADALWDGKAVPDGQQCQKFGGKDPATPALTVSNIPAEANAIIMEYGDRNYEHMNHGGHGKIGYRIEAGTSEASIPSVPGHSLEVPEGFFVVAAHKAPSWDTEGAYLPPCSGGKGNRYGVTVKAVSQSAAEGAEAKVLGEVDLSFGKY